ncbi:MAG: S8 family serine peptidase, partial [Bacillota bacterium]|nr:S8 family serine peptidase [Bacillota bacterium]
MFGCTYVPGGELVEEAHAAGGGADYVEGEVIVCYIDTDDMDLTARQERKADQLLGDAEEIATVENVSLADVSVDESKLTEEVQEAEEVDKTIAAVTSDDKSTEELIEEIEKLPNVDYVEPNYIFKLTEAEAEGEAMTADELEESEEAAAGDEPLAEEEATEENEAELEGTELNASPNYTGLQWAYKKSYGLYVPDWNNPDKKNSEGTVVAVIDSGVDYTHEDLDDVMWSDGNGKHGYDFCNEDSDPMDDNGHGTHCAGIIAAEWNGIGVSGTANGTKIMAVKAASAEGYLDYWDILCSYDYIINQKKRGVNIVAINNSWGSGAESSYGLDEMVTEAGNLGMVSVFSSGNDGRNCDESHTFQSGEGPFTGHYFCYFMKDNPYAIVVDSIASSDTSDSCYLSD